MNILLDNLADFDPVGSVTNKDTGEKLDKDDPYSYVQWLKYSNVMVSSSVDYFEQYTAYLNNWTVIHNKAEHVARSYVIESYKTLLKDITLKYTNDEEKRFLHNIDIENPRHLESALPFYATKIKQIALHYAYERDRIKQQKYSASSYGSTAGLEKSVALVVANAHTSPTNNTLTSNIDPITVQRVIIRELYDISSEITSDTIDHDINIYRDMKQAIRSILNICRPALQLTSEVLLVMRGDIADTREASFDTEITNVPTANFSDYNQTVSSLNIQNQKDYLTKLTGSEIYTKTSTGEITLLSSPDTPWRNLMNRYGPSISNKLNPELRSLKEIGSFFRPQHTGLLTYYSHKPTPVDIGISVDQPLPDLNRFGNSFVSGTTGLNVDHIENVEWLKADISNDALHGDIVLSPDTPLFYGYTSTEEIRPESHHGLSRYTDSYGFFTGHRNEVWANPDVFTLEARNIYDIESRQKSLFVSHDTQFNWRDDIYGNQYGLYKRIEPPRLPTDRSYDADEFESSAGCEILDGGNTLLKRETRFEAEYEIFDGGRHPENDPKIEQFISTVPFPDIRKIDPTKDSPVSHNTHYYGAGLGGEVIGHNPVTFHGFSPSPGFDKQAYGGLFTDNACGIISSRYTSCAIADNYSFIVFTEGPDEDDKYNSRSSAASGFDPFEAYANPHFEGFDPEIGFSEFGATSAVDVTTLPEYDGSTFTAECDFAGLEFSYEVDQSAVLFLDSLTVSKTEYSDDPPGSRVRRPTLYEQKHSTSGKVFYRSYNNKVTDNISNALRPIWDGFVNQRNTAFEQVENDLVVGNIKNLDVLLDCIIIETDNYLLAEKINFDSATTSVLPNKTTNILINTGVYKNVEKCGDWYFAETEAQAILCFTNSFSADNKQLVHPVLHTVDLNTLHYKQTFPNKDYGIETGQNAFLLPDDLSEYQVRQVDRPILTYDADTDTYNVSYSGYLSGAGGDKYCIFMSEYKKRKLNFELIDSYVFHGEQVNKYVKPGKVWEDEIDSKLLRLGSDQPPLPTHGETVYRELHSENFIGYTLSGRGLNLELDFKSMPVGSSKIIDIMIDAGDGSPVKHNQRRIEVDFIDVSYDITKLPDQSDFGDPRKDNSTHEYVFNNSSDYTYTSSVTALYSNYSKLIYNINITTSPGTISSAYKGLKLINTKSYVDTNNTQQQLLVLESQQPQCVTNVIVQKA